VGNATTKLEERALDRQKENKTSAVNTDFDQEKG
jgi:hypothetical protein